MIYSKVLSKPLKVFFNFLVQMTLIMLLVIPAAALDGNEILLQVDRNLQPESYEMYRKLINIEPDGTVKGVCSLYGKKRPRQNGRSISFPCQ